MQHAALEVTGMLCRKLCLLSSSVGDTRLMSAIMDDVLDKPLEIQLGRTIMNDMLYLMELRHQLSTRRMNTTKPNDLSF